MKMADGDKAEYWDEVLEMGHLESRMRAAEVLDSQAEYTFWLAQYTEYIGAKGYTARAEELVKELLGPKYQ